MPIFKYRCHGCLHEFESLERYDDPTPPKCVVCGAADTEREAFPSKAPDWDIKGSSAANNYGLKSGGKPTKQGRFR